MITKTKLAPHKVNSAMIPVNNVEIQVIIKVLWDFNLFSSQIMD